MDNKVAFKQLLTQAIYQIRSQEGRTIGMIQDELGHLIGKSGTLIEHWRKGHIPYQYSDLEKVALFLVKRGDFDLSWLADFLEAGQHPAPQLFITNHFSQSDGSQTNLNLPTTSLPAGNVLPAGSFMPLEQNPLFIGRESQLFEIAAQFTKSSSSVSMRSVSIYGLGGIGKTQLASEFVHRYGQFFLGGIFWLNFEKPDHIIHQVAQLGGPGLLNLQNYQNLTVDDKVQMVRAAWQLPIPRLLIFDNCEDEALLQKWRPISGGCRILITSRRAEWDPSLAIHTLPITVLYRHESVAFLKNMLGLELQSHHPILEEIAGEVGDLPLALHMAGRYLYRYRRMMTPEQYIVRLKNPDLLKHPSLQTDELSPTRHVQNVWRTFSLSYDQLNSAYDIDQYAMALLVRAAHFAPGELIWIDLLLKTFPDDESSEILAMKVEQGFARLLELGLIEADANYSMRMHRLVAAFVRDVASDDVAKMKHVIQTAVLKETARINQHGLPLPLLEWQIHLQSVVDLEDTPNDIHHARLCSEIGEHFKQVKNIARAAPYFKKSVLILKHLAQENQAEVAKAYHNHGWILREQSQFEEAHHYLSAALTLRLNRFGQSHPATAESYNEMGRWHLSQGEFDKAEAHFTQAKEISLAVLEKNHPLTADFLNNLGMCLAFQKKSEVGLNFVQQALEIRKSRFGQDHPRTALSLNNMGYILRDLQRLDEAKKYYRQALTVREKIFGTLNSATAECYINLGDLYLQQEELETAKKQINKAVDIYLTMQQTEHLFLAACYNNLGLIAEKEQDLIEAIAKIEQAVEIRINRLGEQHRATVATLELLQKLKEKRKEAS